MVSNVTLAVSLNALLISLLLAKMKIQNEVALALASSGIAATLVEGGRTAHYDLK